MMVMGVGTLILKTMTQKMTWPFSLLAPSLLLLPSASSASEGRETRTLMNCSLQLEKVYVGACVLVMQNVTDE